MMGPEPGVGAAGRAGVPSDLQVTVMLRTSGGLEIEMRSKVGLYYGDSIRAEVRRVLEAFGVASAQVRVEDQGALPFTVTARVEAAARRAGLGEGRRLRCEGKAKPRPGGRDRRRRSRLYLPGAEPKFFVNARLHAPDAVILDLEDSVHPSEKDTARILVRHTLHAVDFGDCERMVRINQLPLGLADLEEVVPERPDLVLLPKTETPDEVREVETVLRRIEAREGIEGEIWLMPILESALGVENAFAIATASPRVVALTLGLEDLTADLGVVKTPEGEETLYARRRTVYAARAARVQAIDSVYGDVEDLEGLLVYGRRSRAMGYEGMGCIHPRQIPVIHEAYAPSSQEIEKARRIVDAFALAQAQGLGVVALGSKMIDPPVVKRAARLVEEARALGLLVEPGALGTGGG